MAYAGALVVVGMVVSKLVLGVVVIVVRWVGSLPARTRHCVTFVAPFQLAYTVAFPLVVLTVIAGG
jgi:hypothetical protein